MVIALPPFVAFVLSYRQLGEFCTDSEKLATPGFILRRDHQKGTVKAWNVHLRYPLRRQVFGHSLKPGLRQRLIA
jgi:hypothetical protein